MRLPKIFLRIEISDAVDLEDFLSSEWVSGLNSPDD